MPTEITIRCSLLPGGLTAGTDRQLERRIWLADRIRSAASKQTLGPLFVEVEMVSRARVPGPSIAVFTFDATDADVEQLHEKVGEFIRQLSS